MSLFSKPKYSTVVVKKKDIPKGLWTKCPISGEIVFNKELEDNFMVVPKSGYHFPIQARARIVALFAPNTFEEADAKLRSADPRDAPVIGEVAVGKPDPEADGTLELGDRPLYVPEWLMRCWRWLSSPSLWRDCPSGSPSRRAATSRRAPARQCQP